jgi:hypothetical protein
MILFFDYDGVRQSEGFGEDQSFWWIDNHQLILRQFPKIKVIARSD